MAVELIVPKVGESITEVQIVQWLKAEGDRVERDGNIAVIETDKATVELPSPVAGILSKILVPKGTTAKVGAVIGYVEEGAAGKSSVFTGPETTKIPVVPKAPAATATAGTATGAGSATPPSGGPTAGDRKEATVMPSAARALAENKLSAEEVAGTGPGNRILKEDVLRHVEGKAGGQVNKEVTVTPTILPAVSVGGRSEEIVPMSMLRRRVAERLVQAQQTAALLTTFNEIDMTGAMELRQRHQDAFVKKYGIKLGFMSIFVKAAVDALKLVPQINAEVRGNDIVYRHYCDIGVAVGGGKGLVVPVIRNAEQLSFAQVELTIAEFAKRAQANALKLEELQGGTFTISNGGTYGSLLSTPIVNPPQSGVLGMHAIQDRPVARNNQVVIRPMMYVALTYDHRVVDGREAVTFLKRIKETVEDPARILLEI